MFLLLTVPWSLSPKRKELRACKVIIIITQTVILIPNSPPWGSIQEMREEGGEAARKKGGGGVTQRPAFHSPLSWGLSSAPSLLMTQLIWPPEERRSRKCSVETHELFDYIPLEALHEERLLMARFILSITKKAWLPFAQQYLQFLKNNSPPDWHSPLYNVHNKHQDLSQKRN